MMPDRVSRAADLSPQRDVLLTSMRWAVQTTSVNEALPTATSAGLYSLFRTRAQAHWFAQHFPEHCTDGNGVCGTDQHALWSNVRALVPDLKERNTLGLEQVQPDGVVFDLIEYAAERVAKPIEG